MFSRESMITLMHTDENAPQYDLQDYDSFGVLESAVVACQKEGSLCPDADVMALSMSLWSSVHGLSCLCNEGVLTAMGGARGYTEEFLLSEITAVTSRILNGCTADR
jgi:hypothetical protein